MAKGWWVWWVPASVLHHTINSLRHTLFCSHHQSFANIHTQVCDTLITPKAHTEMAVNYLGLLVLWQGYGDVFIHKVKQKHTLARNYFSRLPGMAELIRQHAADNTQTMAPGPSTIAGQALSMQTQKV